MNRWTRRLAQGLSLLALGFVGCAQEREPINRVQPNALDKAFFVGQKLNDDSDNPEFYSRAFVIDQSVGQDGLSVGLYSGTDRIKWEVTEDALIGRKSYQIAVGQDPHGVPGQTPVNGTIVAKYKITSHFDVKRSYNPQTGEELNIVEENTTDRPWQERQYMRVDWSTNQVLDPMWTEMFFGKIFGDMNVEPLTYNITNPTSEDAPHFEAKDGYFDVTNKYYVSPGETSMWGFTFPTCALVGLYTSTTTADCNAQEATVRHSFWKVDPNHDYEPTENTLRKMDVIANFGGAGDSFQPGFAGGTTQCWDPQYAYTDACFHQYLAKLNFWEKSHWSQECNSNDDGNNDGTADQCVGFSDENGTAVAGSQCDTHYMTQHPGTNGRCTIPLRARHLTPQGFWFNKETPTELLDAVDEAGVPINQPVSADGAPTKRGALEDVVKTWNQLLTASIAYGREVECRRTGAGDRNACHAQYFVQEGGGDKTQMVAFGGWGIPVAAPQPNDAPAALVACHAPVRDYDYHQVCGKTGEVARNGDQRKNFIFYWPYDSDAHYGGVAGLGQDPETGEEHGVTATVMGRSATRAAAVYRDYLQIAMGDVSVDDFNAGVPQYIYNKVQQNGYSPDSTMARIARGEKIQYGNPNASAPRASELKNKATGPEMTTKPAKLEQQRFVQLLADRRDSAMTPALQSNAQPLWESYAAKLRGTPYEAQIVDPTWAMAAVGSDPRKPMTDGLLEEASPLRNLDHGRLDQWRAQIAGTLANRGICFVDDIARVGSINFQGLARWYMDKFADLGMDSDVQKDATGVWIPGPRDPGMIKKRGDVMYQEMFHGMAAGIAIHEVGHTLGMRHNFASSYDAPNFMPQYWQLRTNEGNSADACTGPRAVDSPDTCMGVRYDDPQSTDELGFADRDGAGRSQGHPSVGYFGNSTCMEYEQDYMSPGVGPYDFMYTKAVYGGVLETYDLDAPNSVGEQGQDAFVANLAAQRAEWSLENDSFAHYTHLARDLKVFDPGYCRDATPEELAQGEWRVVHGKICTQSPRDHEAWQDFVNDSDDGIAPPTVLASYGWLFTAWHAKTNAPNSDGRMHQRWNYRYGETYGSGYLHTNYSDNGADAYEVTVNNSQMFDVTYPISYFRRNNKEFSYFNIPSSTARRYFERARSFHWILEGSSGMGEVNGLYQQAEKETFYFLARAAMSPEPGPMKSSPQADGNAVYDVDSSNLYSWSAEFQMPLIDGRYVGEEFSDAKGGQWDYLSWIDHAGFGMERGLAIGALLDGRPTLYTISRETFLDGRNVMKNYRIDDPDGVDRLIGGILSEDWNSIAPWVKDEVPGVSVDGLPVKSPQMLNLLDAAPSRPAGAQVVFPNLGFKSQMQTLLWTMLYSAMNSDKTLMKKARVYIEGIDFIGAIPDTELVKFTDPNTGYTYVARKFGDDTVAGSTIDRGIASRMLQHANTLLAKNQTDALTKYVGLIDAAHDLQKLLWPWTAIQLLDE
jgi:Met-zincin